MKQRKQEWTTLRMDGRELWGQLQYWSFPRRLHRHTSEGAAGNVRLREPLPPFRPY